MIEVKICNSCNIKKDLNDYHKNTRSKDGYMNKCKECRKIDSKNRYNIKITCDKSFVENKQCVSCGIEKKINHFHKQIEAIDGYRSECKECRKIRWKINYPRYMEKHRLKSKNYRINNREKYNSFFKERYEKYPHIYAWRGMLSSVLRRLGKKKENTTYNMLGYSANDLKTHIEKLFTNGMTWENWGEWHIDHIIPVSKFDQNTDPKIVNSLNNLQPLWMKDNIKKSNK